jgi:hypothetical protein
MRSGGLAYTLLHSPTHSCTCGVQKKRAKNNSWGRARATPHTHTHTPEHFSNLRRPASETTSYAGTHSFASHARTKREDFPAGLIPQPPIRYIRADSPHGRSARMIRADGPHERSTRTVRPNGPRGPSARQGPRGQCARTVRAHPPRGRFAMTVRADRPRGEPARTSRADCPRGRTARSVRADCLHEGTQTAATFSGAGPKFELVAKWGAAQALKAPSLIHRE